MKTILGIDNGVGGALSFYDGDELIIYDMPTFKVNKRNVIDVPSLFNILQMNEFDHAFIEKLTPFKGSRLSFFSMGHSEGLVIGLMTALKKPYTLVRPAKWKKTMQCTADKDSARHRAGQLFPNETHQWSLKKDVDKAEASLIALYGFNQ